MDQSTKHVYVRLLRSVRPYRGRLIVGIVAGLLVGGSLFGLLGTVPNLIRPFIETPAATAAPDVDEGVGIVPGDKGGLVKKLAERLGVDPEKDDGTMTWQFMVLSLMAMPPLVFIYAFADYLNRYNMRWVAARVVLGLRDRLFSGLQSQSLTFFGKSDVGRLISRCTNDTALVETLLATTVADLVRAPLEIAAAVAIVLLLSAAHGLLGLVSAMFIVFPLLIVPIVVLGRYVKRHTRKALERISDLVSRMHENFTGVRVVKAFNMEERECERFAEMNEGYFKSIVRALRAELLMSPLMIAVSLLTILSFFVVCYSRGVPLDFILTVGFAAVIVYRPMKQLARVGANMHRGAAALERIFKIVDTDTSLKETPDAVNLAEFTDRIVFDHVHFGYGPDGPPILSDICLEIPAGSVIALVGETGVGKTTLANLLARFYDPTEGRVLLDGTDVRNATIESLRRLIGVVTQETILFNDTVASNIAYGSEGAKRDAIENAARQANAHEFIVSAEEGYDRVVGEKGFMLSGGERQRIAIARAILKNPPILILDEATSALDTVTERLVQEAIARLMKGRTVLAIAHRLSTIRHANQIVLLEGGRITERGTHDELWSANGRYRELCEMQVLDD
jgi:subfamily B ATP-binding cassette protein MsbA